MTEWPVRVVRARARGGAPPLGWSYRFGGAGGRWRWPWIYAVDGLGGLWLMYIVLGGRVGVMVMVAPSSDGEVPLYQRKRRAGAIVGVCEHTCPRRRSARR